MNKNKPTADQFTLAILLLPCLCLKFMGLQCSIYPKASHFLFNVTKCLKTCWLNLHRLCFTTVEQLSSFKSDRICLYEINYNCYNSGICLLAHKCSQNKDVFSPGCSCRYRLEQPVIFFNVMSIHRDFQICQLKTAFSRLWIYELAQPGCWWTPGRVGSYLSLIF